MMLADCGFWFFPSTSTARRDDFNALKCVFLCPDKFMAINILPMIPEFFKMALFALKFINNLIRKIS